MDELQEKNNENWETNIFSLETYNSSISDTILPAEYEIECNEIMLAVNFNITGLTETQIDYLYFLANLCPLKGGKAVFRARSVLRLINDSIVYDDQSTCNAELALRKGRVAIEEKQNVELIGNPINSNSKFVFDHATEIACKLNIYNGMNELVYQKEIPANSLNIVMPLLKMSGLYFYTIVSNKEIIGQGKIIFIK